MSARANVVELERARTVSSATALEQTGATYRQLDYWARVGYVHPLGNGAGCGSRRRWPELELDVAAAMSRLVAAGLSVPVAATAARVLVAPGPDGSIPCVELAPGVCLFLDDETGA